MDDLDKRFWSCWVEELKTKIWWFDISEEFAYHLLRNTLRAHKANAEYFFQGLENVELTKIFDQCKLVSILAKETHGTEV
jgi:hypothetical protein